MLSLLHHHVISQQYPVQVTTTIAPPYSVYLSDYTSPESNSLRVLIHLLELDRTNLRVKLRLTIEGAGIVLQTRPSYAPPAIVLQGGVPELLTGYDLRSYFNPDNLVFSGITASAFMQGGKLPEGFYAFTVEVIEYTRNVQVSAPMSGKSNAWIVLNDPPLINWPFNGDKVKATDPQNILFSWTPRHTASPNAAFTTEYEFRLIELYPGQSNPDVAIRSSNSIYTTTTTQSSLNYSIIEPSLVPGRKYAFRIRAYDTSRRDLFKNDGYSETFVFQYGEACTLPSQISAEALGPSRARFTWEPEMVHTGFTLQYRKAGSSRWFEKQVLSSSQIIPDLTGSTTYEYRVQPRCGTIVGEAGPIQVLTTPEVDENAFVCGAPVPEFNMDPNPLMKPLLPLDVIKIGDWDVNLTSIHSNGDGTYAGAGYAAVPYLNMANVRVTFDRILVNKDYRVIAGNIRTVYSTESRFVMELDKAPVEMEAIEPEEEEIMEEAPVGPESSDLAFNVPSDTGSVEVSDGEMVAMDEEGNPVAIEGTAVPEEGEELAFTDSDGDSTAVDSGGSVSGGPVTSSEDAGVGPVLSGLSRNPEMVVIHAITESFKPGTDRAEFTYSIRDTTLLPYRQLEIYHIDEDKNEELVTFYELETGEEIAFLDARDEDKKGWSGQGNDLEYVKAGNYKFVVTATQDATFKNGFVEWEMVEVVREEIKSEGDLVFDYFVSDEDAWYRQKEAPHKPIKPEPKTDIIEKGTQVALLEFVKDSKGEEVAKMQLKSSGKIEYTTLSNLTQVKKFPQERKYKLLQDYKALVLPFASKESDETYKKGVEVTVDKYCGDYLKVKGIGGEVEGNWIPKSAVLWIDLITKEKLLAETKESTKIGTKFKGNETDAACNVCVRSALLLLKEDPVLFPLEGSAYYDPGNSFNVSYPKGYITNPGQAINIKHDMDVIATKIRLNERFEEIPKLNTEEWEDYFKRIQDKADLGGIVIGVMLNSSGTSGHVMMVTPGGLVNIKKENQADFEPKWGASFTRVKINKLPKVLECGKGARENDVPLCRNVDRNGAQLRLKWFEYKN